MHTRLAVLLFALTAVLPATAQPSTPGGLAVRAVLEGSLEYGGDRVARFLFTNGDTQSMRAGQGGSVAVGVEVRPSQASRVGLRATGGIKYVTTAADNANITLTRLPLELTGLVEIARGFRAGAGVVHHARIRFNGDGFVDDLGFDGATGATVEAGWKYVALTYTVLRYRDEEGNTYDAGSPGLTLSYTFPLTGR